VTRFKWVLASVLMLVCLNAASDEGVPPELEPVQPLLAELTRANFTEAVPVLEQLAEQGGEALLPLFETMLAGDLYYQKSDFRFYQLERTPERTYEGKPLFVEGAEIQTLSPSAFKKIRVNNALRGVLKTIIAKLQVAATDVDTRHQAVKVMMGDMDAEQRALLKNRLDEEPNGRIIKAIEQALALYDLRYSGDTQVRISALEVLSGSLNQEVRNTLQGLVSTDAQGAFREPDKQVRLAAQEAIEAIESRIDFFNFAEQLFFGLSLGSVLLLAAIGLAITFGVMGVINMAHGEMIMLGAYTTYVVQLLMPNHIEWSIWVAIPAAFLVSGLVGVLVERGVIQFLKGRPLETLLATFGISLILQQLVRTVFSPLNRSVSSPEWLSGSLVVNDVFSITYNRLYILVFALLVFLALQLVLKKTRLGLNVRAVSQNRNMAKAMGVRTEWVDAMTFGLGSGIAGIAGVALSQLTNVGPNLGQSYIIDSFMVVVFGGVGNLLGTLVGGFTLGVTSKFLEPLTGAVLANIFILVVIILFIQRRPQGLFPQKGRAAND